MISKFAFSEQTALVSLKTHTWMRVHKSNQHDESVGIAPSDRLLSATAVLPVITWAIGQIKGRSRLHGELNIDIVTNS